MRKFLISIISIFIGFSVFAAGENIPTSKSYVDSILVPKQDIIEGTNDAPRVLTNTGTAGEYGTKDIYDSTDTYSGQMDALIDAVTMNTAVQNAIDSEFQCVEYNPNDPTDCWLMDIRGTTETRIKNLFDISNATLYRSSANGNGSRITFFGAISESSKAQTYGFGVEPNTTYTISKVGGNRLAIGGFNTVKTPSNMNLSVDYSYKGIVNIETGSVTFTTDDDCIWILFTVKNNTDLIENATNIQIERGNTATPYQPYGNIYVPSEN